jgi:hypothetical protein
MLASVFGGGVGVGALASICQGYRGSAAKHYGCVCTVWFEPGGGGG